MIEFSDLRLTNIHSEPNTQEPLPGMAPLRPPDRELRPVYLDGLSHRAEKTGCLWGRPSGAAQEAWLYARKVRDRAVVSEQARVADYWYVENERK